MFHMIIKLHFGFLLVLLKTIPDLFAQALRNLFISSLNISITSLQLLILAQLSSLSFHNFFSCFLPFHLPHHSNYIPFSLCFGSLDKTNFW